MLVRRVLRRPWGLWVRPPVEVLVVVMVGLAAEDVAMVPLVLLGPVVVGALGCALGSGGVVSVVMAPRPERWWVWRRYGLRMAAHARWPGVG